MQRKRLIVAIVVVAVVAGGGYLAWRLTHPPLPDIEQINQVFARLETAIETKSPRAILDEVADDYNDGLNQKRDLRRISYLVLRVQGSPRVIIDDLKVKLHGQVADATLTGSVRIGQSEGAPEFSGTVVFHLRKEGGRWLMVSSQGWQGLAAEGMEQ